MALLHQQMQLRRRRPPNVVHVGHTAPPVSTFPGSCATLQNAGAVATARRHLGLHSGRSTRPGTPITPCFRALKSQARLSMRNAVLSFSAPNRGAERYKTEMSVRGSQDARRRYPCCAVSAEIALSWVKANLAFSFFSTCSPPGILHF